MKPRAGIFRRLLRRRLDPATLAEVESDLEERYAARAAREGRAAANAWRIRQEAGLLWWAWRHWTPDDGPATSSGRFAGVWTDLSLAARSLRARPGFAAVAVLTLALGIGANTAVFSVVDAVILRPLPFPDPHELVAIHETRVGQSWWSAAPANARAWRERSRTLEDVAWAQTRRGSLLSSEGEPEPIAIVAASSNLFDLLHVRMAAGRTFTEEEDEVGASPVVILTHETWSGRFGMDRGVLGTRLTVDGEPHTVIGILPPGASPTFFGAHDVIVPRVLSEPEILNRGRILQSIGRTAEGIDLEAARAEMSALAEELDVEAAGASARGWGAELVPLREQMVGASREALLGLFAAVGLVLLVACANLSNLMLARGSARSTELAVRASLGSGRGRLIRHLLAEAGLIAGLGAAAGVTLAVWGTRALLALDPTVLPRDAGSPLDARVLMFTLAASALAALLFGLVPAVRVTRVDLAEVFFAGGARTGSSRGTRRLQQGLIGAEVALVVVLLAGAGLTLRSVQSMTEVEPGFDTESALAVRLTLPASRYADSASIGAFVRALTDRAGAIPGVEAAGTVTTLPLSGGPGYTSFHVARSLPTPAPGEEPLGGMEIVGPGYFEAMGIPVVQGRGYRTGDIGAAEPIIIVDEAVVDALGVTSPLTDAIRMAPPGAGAAAAWREIVGVVGSVRYGLDADVRPRIYLTEGQVGFTLRPRTLVVRVRPGSAERVIPAVREAVRSVDPLLPIERIEWLDEVSHSSISRARLQSTLLGLFALVALVLGAVGVYGVVSYSVARRTREVGLRLALGSSRQAVLGHVVREAMAPVLLGLGLGVAASAAASRGLAALLPAVDAMDAVALVGGPATLLPVALLASMLPALRASRVDPVEALREE